MSMKDRSQQIEELETELRMRGASFYVGDEFDDDMRESFLRHVLEFEDAPETTIRAQLAAHGHEVPDDLWPLIGHLAELNVVIERTNHLDDTALREFLLELLDQPVPVSNDPGTIMHVDVVGSGSDEDNALFFRYYASDEEREHWMREFPDETLPPRERPPHDRDRFLPTAENLRGGRSSNESYGELTPVRLRV
jgi:hypothetical protein